MIVHLFNQIVEQDLTSGKLAIYFEFVILLLKNANIVASSFIAESG